MNVGHIKTETLQNLVYGKLSIKMKEAKAA